jgi:MFS family permease
VYTAGSAWIVDLAPEERRGRVLGLYGLAVWGGLSVGPLLGEVLLDAGGYDLVWIFAAALPVLGALIALAARDPFVPLAHAEPHPLIAPEAVGPGFAVGLASFGYAAVATFIVLHLESRGVGHGATVFAAFAAMIVLTRLVFGNLPDRMGAAPVAIAATVGEACGLLLIAVAHSLPVALAGGIAMGAAFALLNPSLMLIALGRVSQQARGAAMGTYTAFFDAGVGLGAPIAGVVAALTNYEGAFIFAATVCLASALMIFVRLHPARSEPPGNPPTVR